MRNVLRLALSMTLLGAQATTSFPDLVAASAESTKTADVSQLEVSINTKTMDPVMVKSAQPVDFETEVLAPMKANQAAEAKAAEEAAAAEASAKAAAEAQAAEAARIAAAQATASKPVVIDTGDAWSALRMCEAGGNYARNSGNGYYGAYQFDISTWNNFGGYARPDLAPASVQDAKAQDTQARRGWSPWPGCARKLGLL